MKNYKSIIILLNLVLLLVYFNYSVVEKENLLEEGKLILLVLAPVDPRSLMQGDYMQLRYEISEKTDFETFNSESMPKRGYCVINLDSSNVANKVRFQTQKIPLYKGEYLIKYTNFNYQNVNIGAESFFFQEGQGQKYEKAEYGGLKIDKNGNSLLIGLYDESRKKIE